MKIKALVADPNERCMLMNTTMPNSHAVYMLNCCSCLWVLWRCVVSDKTPWRHLNRLLIGWEHGWELGLAAMIGCWNTSKLCCWGEADQTHTHYRNWILVARNFSHCYEDEYSATQWGFACGRRPRDQWVCRAPPARGAQGLRARRREGTLTTVQLTPSNTSALSITGNL